MEVGAVGGRRVVEAVVMGAVGGVAAILDLLVAGVQFEKSDEANCNPQLKQQHALSRGLKPIPRSNFREEKESYEMLTFTSYIFGNNLREKTHIYSEFSFSEKFEEKKIFAHADKVKNLFPCLK
jgi:hypothetical protein